MYERFNTHRYCFFVYAQDHTAAPLTIDGEGLGTTVFSPAFEVAFIWRFSSSVRWSKTSSKARSAAIDFHVEPRGAVE